MTTYVDPHWLTMRDEYVSGLPYIALVRNDGTESERRYAWTGTYFDAGKKAIIGDRVSLTKLDAGTYVRWRIYSRGGEYLGGGVLPATKVKQGQTLTLEDLMVILKPIGEQS